MRLWSLHPKYLDTKGLLGLWREALLAKAVLENRTFGYKNHPQLIRFRRHPYPVAAINLYLWYVYAEANVRGYRFDIKKLDVPKHPVDTIPVTIGQLLYEWRHLLNKLKLRDPIRFHRLINLPLPEPHPIMVVVSGEIEEWERLKT